MINKTQDRRKTDIYLRLIFFHLPSFVLSIPIIAFPMAIFYREKVTNLLHFLQKVPDSVVHPVDRIRKIPVLCLQYPYLFRKRFQCLSVLPRI